MFINIIAIYHYHENKAHYIKTAKAKVINTTTGHGLNNNLIATQNQSKTLNIKHTHTQMNENPKRNKK